MQYENMDAASPQDKTVEISRTRLWHRTENYWITIIILLFPVEFIKQVGYLEKFYIYGVIQHCPILLFLIYSLIKLPICSAGFNYGLTISFMLVDLAFVILVTLAPFCADLMTTICLIFAFIFGSVFCLMFILLLVLNYNRTLTYDEKIFCQGIVGFSIFTTPILLGIIFCVIVAALCIEFVIRLAICKLQCLITDEVKLFSTRSRKATLFTYEILGLGDLSCTICSHKFLKTETVVCLKCQPSHIFHPECIQKHANQASTCPICKKQLDFK